jgi:hypothetical protein
MEEGWEQAAQCLGMPLTFPHSERAVPYRARDGCTAPAWPHSAGARFPGDVRGSAWRGFTF